MPINSDKPHLWKADVARSIDFYNDWYFRFAPGAYCKQRITRRNDPLINLDLEKKQRVELKRWLLRHGYKQIVSDDASNLTTMLPGTFTFPLTVFTGKKKTPPNNPTVCVVKPMYAGEHDYFFIEAKSTGNAAIINRWHKQQGQKLVQITEHYGENVRLVLLLCGHFDAFYLGYQAAEGIGWVWEHRLDDLSILFTGGHKMRVVSNRYSGCRVGPK